MIIVKNLKRINWIGFCHNYKHLKHINQLKAFLKEVKLEESAKIKLQTKNQYWMRRGPQINLNIYRR